MHEVDLQEHIGNQRPWTCESLREAEPSGVIREVTRQRLGVDVSLRFVLGEAPERDKLDELIRRGRKFDSFTVK